MLRAAEKWNVWGSKFLRRKMRAKFRMCVIVDDYCARLVAYHSGAWPAWLNGHAKVWQWGQEWIICELWTSHLRYWLYHDLGLPDLVNHRGRSSDNFIPCEGSWYCIELHCPCVLLLQRVLRPLPKLIILHWGDHGVLYVHVWKTAPALGMEKGMSIEAFVAINKDSRMRKRIIFT